MSETFNNVPMSEATARTIEKQDRFWDGPKLLVLSFVTLGAVFAFLWLCAEGVIGPSPHEVNWGDETHLMQGNAEPRPLD